MRFLEDHELPEAERERRKLVREIIADIEEKIAAEWKDAEPELIRAVREGSYHAERDLRHAVHRRTELMREQIAMLKNGLPPVVHMREDGYLEMIPVLKRPTGPA